MPLGIFLLWPALHIMYGLKEYRSKKVDIKRRYTGRIIIFLSIFLINQPYGFEKGIFYWLFAFMAIALIFVQLRIWQPMLVKILSTLSLVSFSIIGLSYVLN